jgi:ribosomal protein S13
MADLAGDTIKNLLQDIIREATTSMRTELRELFSQETASLRTELKDMIQTELKDMRADIIDLKSDVKVIKTVQGQHGIMLRTTQTDMNSLKTGYHKQSGELTRLSGLFEDFEHYFQAASELS